MSNGTPSDHDLKNRHLVMLFDGVCNFCNATVQFVIKRDPSQRITFCPLQIEAGRKRLREFGLDTKALYSIVVIEKGRAYLKSSAALRTARRLRFPWPLLYVFIIIPPVLRNWVYDFIARNRYRWFGKRTSCMIPSDADKARFIDS